MSTEDRMSIQRLCPTCDEGIAWGRARMCRACRAESHRVSAREHYRRTVGTQRNLLCEVCERPHGRRIGARACRGACARKLRAQIVARHRERNPKTEAQRARERAMAKARRCVGPGEAALRLMEEWVR
jgi:hypothetical protein